MLHMQKKKKTLEKNYIINKQAKNKVKECQTYETMWRLSKMNNCLIEPLNQPHKAKRDLSKNKWPQLLNRFLSKKSELAP